MRLLVVTPEYPPHAAGGILKYYELMTAAWSAAGAHVSVLMSSPFCSFDSYEHGGIKVYSTSLERINWHAAHLTHLAAAPSYRQWIAAGLAARDWVQSTLNTFDVIETTDFGLLFAPLVNVRDRPPLVVKLHGSIGQMSEHEPSAPAKELDVALARLTEAAVLPSVNALHACSHANAAEWQLRLGRDVVFVPVPLPLPSTTLAAPEAHFAGVVVGRIQAWKGPELLCRAFQLLGEAVPSTLKVAWVGWDTDSGPHGQSMSEWLATAYPDVWGSRILPIGRKNSEQVAQLQASARFVLVPSSWDTFNYSLAEAMALGAVTIASTGAGASYLIDHGKNGFCFPHDDPQALAELLLRAWKMDNSERKVIGLAARSTVARDLDPRKAAIVSLSKFESLQSSQRPNAPNSWIAGFFESSSDRTVATAYLDNLGIRQLATHLTTRVKRRILG